jgi:ElaB/YqjD/DUF883 family membrane-anchored ribosome-binding protein
MSGKERGAKRQHEQAQQAGEEAAQAVKDETGVGERPPSDPDALREDIAETREELGDTVEALSEKADLKGQAKARVEDQRRALRQRQAEAKARLEGLRGQLSEATPEDARRAAAQAATTAKDRPLPALALALALGLVLGRLTKRG